jgi:hypothetical protein
MDINEWKWSISHIAVVNLYFDMALYKDDQRFAWLGF